MICIQIDFHKTYNEICKTKLHLTPENKSCNFALSLIVCVLLVSQSFITVYPQNVVLCLICLLAEVTMEQFCKQTFKLAPGAKFCHLIY